MNAVAERFTPPEDHPIEFHYLGFGASSIDFQIRFWVNATEKITKLQVVSEAIVRIKKAFDKNNINIPFPIRTLQMDDALKLQTQPGSERHVIQQANGQPVFEPAK